MKHLLIVIALVGLVQSAYASGSYIVELKEGTNVTTFSIQNGLKLKKLIPNQNLYLATPQSTHTVEAKALANLRGQTAVKFAQKNHPLTWRNKLTPNDPNFAQQWDWTLDESSFGIDATAAWAVYGAGGLTRTGKEIVIAIVDGGFDINHPDLKNNLWVNSGEIAGNNIDDDGNGYIDDINGWDVEANNGTLQVDSHGTHVAGTMGAEGNNSLNGSGVNWKIKIMYVSMGWSLANTDETMAAYGYILKQKELYNQTNGAQGANVVAINSSFGIDQADCNSGEYVAWNEMFDKLGAQGILSVAATANSSWDIDQVGDVPTGCKSDYMVAVTNSEKNGERSDAGYGKTTIELAAPGTDILSTLPDSGFGSNTGTSMATPHVTGAVGYLYSAASESFLTEAATNPGVAALKLRDIIVKTVTARESMKNESISGGILNLMGAAAEIANYASPVTTPVQPPLAQ